MSEYKKSDLAGQAFEKWQKSLMGLSIVGIVLDNNFVAGIVANIVMHHSLIEALFRHADEDNKELCETKLCVSMILMDYLENCDNLSAIRELGKEYQPLASEGVRDLEF